MVPDRVVRCPGFQRRYGLGPVSGCLEMYLADESLETEYFQELRRRRGEGGLAPGVTQRADGKQTTQSLPVVLLPGPLFLFNVNAVRNPKSVDRRGIFIRSGGVLNKST